MKRFFILASAAIVALASCAKTEVVYNDAPEEIAFKPLTGVMTKAAVTGTEFPTGQSMTVYSWLNEGKSSYFGPVTFTKTGSNTYWNASPAQYYPVGKSLDFVAYTDATPTIVSVTTSADPVAPSYNTYEYTLADNSTAQHDFMVSNYVVNKSKSSSAVSINFHHALALVDVQFKASGSDVTVNKVTLTGTKQQGTVSVTYSIPTEEVNTDPTIAAWNVSSAPTKDVQSTAGSVDFVNNAIMTHYDYFLVVPESSKTKKLVIDYTLNGKNLNHTVDLQSYTDATNWAPGHKYVFEITIGIEEIKFTPSVIDWVDDVTHPTPSI